MPTHFKKKSWQQQLAAAVNCLLLLPTATFLLFDTSKVLKNVLLLLLISGCYTQSRVSNQNLSYLYRKDITFIHPQYYIYHLSDTVTRLFVAVNSKELLYSREPGKDEFSSSIKVVYTLFQSAESADITDSGTVFFTHVSGANMNNPDEKGDTVIRFVDMKIRKPFHGLLEVVTSDDKRNQFALSYFDIDKDIYFSRQSFLAYRRGDDKPFFGNNVTGNEEITVKCPSFPDSVVYVYYYHRTNSLPPPPFSVHNPPPFNYRPDSVFRITISRAGTITLYPFRPGFYHILTDTLRKEGLTFFRFHDDFPQVTTPEQLIECIRYFTTRQEYNELVIELNKKAALDNFWLKIAGNRERAKNLIKTYYNRIREANEFFSSYAEGWKTDRGMIYVIFGYPDAVYRTSSTETWVYGEEGAFLSFNFLFVKVRNPFTDNDYRLERTPIYKNIWYRAVEAWRQGVVY